MDLQTQYDRLCAAVKQMLAAQEDADNNRMVQSKKMAANKIKREVIELMNPEKRIVSQSVMQWEGK